MKLRLQANSVRLRLRQGEVRQLVEQGVIEEAIQFLPTRAVLTYRLELSESAAAMTARLKDAHVIIEVPVGEARAWAADANKVALEAMQPAGKDANHALTILVEKDFACLDGSDAQNEDTFPNPLAGSTC